MALTDAKVRAAKPGKKPYKTPDGEGLYLYVTPAGAKRWRFKYPMADKEKLLVLGAYPIVSLADARGRRKAAKEQIDQGVDPAIERQKAKIIKRTATQTAFKTVALEWHENEKANGMRSTPPSS